MWSEDLSEAVECPIVRLSPVGPASGPGTRSFDLLAGRPRRGLDRDVELRRIPEVAVERDSRLQRRSARANVAVDGRLVLRRSSKSCIFGRIRQPLQQVWQLTVVEQGIEVALEPLDPSAGADSGCDGTCIESSLGIQPSLESAPPSFVHRSKRLLARGGQGRPDLAGPGEWIIG